MRFHEDLGMRLHLSTAYHPHIDGQNEQIIQAHEDMLRPYVIDFGGCKYTYLPLSEFSYNKSYHSSIVATPYELLYGRKCHTRVC